MKFISNYFKNNIIGKMLSRKKKPKKHPNQAAHHVQINADSHLLSLEQLSQRLNTSLADGLSSKLAQDLLLKFGRNRIKQKTQSPFLRCLGYFFSGFCPIIWLAAIICILAYKPIGDPPDPTNLSLGIMLILVIILQAAFSAFQDWSSSKVMRSIKNMMPNTVSVIRDGVEVKKMADELVVGDLIILTYGTKVAADIRIIEAHELKFDKSMLTGESEAVEGTVECTNQHYIESKNIAFMASLITNGNGKGLVVATGGETMIGHIAKLTMDTGQMKTSLQKELQRFIIIIGIATVSMAVLVIILWASWLRIKHPNYIKLPDMLVNTISVIVAFIPEGLPVCVTLSLLIVAKRMAKSHVLVKNLATIETLSCVNVIASDKTGTLTQNKMFVASSSIGLDNVKLEGGSNYDKEKYDKYKQSNGFKQLIAACTLCNNAVFDQLDAKTSVRQRKAAGDATDIALLKFSTEYEIKNLKENYLITNEIPFNSKNKWMMKLFKSKDYQFHKSIFSPDASTHGQDGDDEVMLLKGAPDILLKKCSTIINKDGEEYSVTNKVISDVVKLQNDWCIMGQRVLILCKKRIQRERISSDGDGDNLNASKNFNALSLVSSAKNLQKFVTNSNDFCIIGLVGIIDPPREGIHDVICKCRSAGIRVFMVTGDYALTAAAIATQIGIFTTTQYDTAETMRLKHKINHDSYETSSLLLTGTDLENMTPDEWRLVTPYTEIVFARTTPEQKLKTVNEFQRDKYIVGVTGDGVNDAPALKSADIGIAMGSGSDVAMEAAELVLLDNNFSAVLIAIENGRLVFANLRKVILYLLPGGCMAELIPVLMSIFLGVPQNLSSFQMLIICLFTDIAPSLSLMLEKPETNLLDQPPRNKKDHLVDWTFIIQAYLFLGVFISFFSQTLFFIYMQFYAGLMPSDILLSFGSWNNGFKNHTSAEIENYQFTGQTVTFISIVLMQIFGNLLSTRTHVKSFIQQTPWKKRSNNPWIFLAQLISIIIMLLIVFVPAVNMIFNTRQVPAQFFFLPFIFCFVIVGLDEIRKLFVRRKLFKFHKWGW